MRTIILYSEYSHFLCVNETNLGSEIKLLLRHNYCYSPINSDLLRLTSNISVSDVSGFTLGKDSRKINVHSHVRRNI